MIDPSPPMEWVSKPTENSDTGTKGVNFQP